MFSKLIKLATTLCFLSVAWQFHRYSNTTFSYLYIGSDVPEYLCDIIVWVMVFTLCFSSISIWISKPILRYASLSATLTLLLEAYCSSVYPPETTAICNLPSYGIRYLLPIAILFIHHNRPSTAYKVLTLGIALTFTGHGVKALMEEPLYLDYILAFFSDIGSPIQLSTSILFLHVVGTIDVLVSLQICFLQPKRLKWIFYYMATWGLVTGFARITYGDISVWHEVTLRAPHFLIPVALAMVAKKSK